MTETIRFYSKIRADKIEADSGIRVIASVFVKRPGQKPLFVRAIVSPINQ